MFNRRFFLLVALVSLGFGGCGKQPTENIDSEEGDGSARGRLAVASTNPPYCAGQCIINPGNVGTGGQFYDCQQVIYHSGILAANGPITPVPPISVPANHVLTSCSNITHWLADMKMEGSHILMECPDWRWNMTTNMPEVTNPANCLARMALVKPLKPRMQIAPDQMPDVPGSAYYQTIGGNFNPGSPPVGSSFTVPPPHCPHANIVYNADVNRCGAMPTFSNEVGDYLACKEPPKQDYFQWINLVGTPSIKEPPTPDPVGKIVCAGNMTWAAFGIFAGGFMAPVAIPAIVSGVGGIVASAPQCINAFNPSITGFSEWHPKENQQTMSLPDPRMSGMLIPQGKIGNINLEYKFCKRKFKHRWVWNYKTEYYVTSAVAAPAPATFTFHKQGSPIPGVSSEGFYHRTKTLNEYLVSDNVEKCNLHSAPS